MERFFDVCDCCGSRDLEFVLFDLMDVEVNAWVKDIPAYRCRACEEVLLSAGVIDVLDEIKALPEKSVTFPIIRYQRRVLQQSGIERDVNERLLHAWSIIRIDGRDQWALMGSRSFGDLTRLTAI